MSMIAGCPILTERSVLASGGQAIVLVLRDKHDLAEHLAGFHVFVRRASLF